MRPRWSAHPHRTQYRAWQPAEGHTIGGGPVFTHLPKPSKPRLDFKVRFRVSFFGYRAPQPSESHTIGSGPVFAYMPNTVALAAHAVL